MTQGKLERRNEIAAQLDAVRLRKGRMARFYEKEIREQLRVADIELMYLDKPVPPPCDECGHPEAAHMKGELKCWVGLRCPCTGYKEYDQIQIEEWEEELEKVACECVSNCCEGEHAGYCFECAGWGEVDCERCDYCNGSGICPKCGGMTK